LNQIQAIYKHKNDVKYPHKNKNAHIHITTKRDRKRGDKRLPSMQAFVEVDGVLSGDNLLLSPFAGLVHHFCRSALSDPTTTRLHLRLLLPKKP
jgi:hypothetical protein